MSPRIPTNTTPVPASASGPDRATRITHRRGKRREELPSRFGEGRGGDSQAQARVFAALGDATRLSIVARLSGGAPRSISSLTADTRLTRQAVTKHLRILEGAGLVRSARRGREHVFELDPAPLDEMREYLARISAAWDETLSRLAAYVESDN